MQSVELCAGCGGLALGLEYAGFEHVALVEQDVVAAKTLTQNRPAWNVICADVMDFVVCNQIEQICKKHGGALDLLSGGIPCQPFSYAGKRTGLEDSRGTLIYSYVTILRKLQPKMFLLENVKGLLTHQQGQTYTYIRSLLEDSGYVVYAQVLNAVDYGVAQKRERLFIVGLRKDLSNSVTFEFPEVCTTKKTLRDVLNNVPKSDGISYSDAKKQIMALVPEGGNWRNIDTEIAKKYMKGCYSKRGGYTGVLRRLAWDAPSVTIMTSPSQKTTDRCHPTETRPLTVRESARIQSFPDDWSFCGTIMQQYKQIGNAVPVDLAKAVGLAIKKTLTKVQDTENNK